MKNLYKMIVMVGFIFCCLFAVDYGVSYAGVPHLINYQGRLTDKLGKPLEGAYNVTFRIYDAETAGSMLWEETHGGMVIEKGVFSVLLGSVIPLNLAFDKQYYLEIKIDSDVMSPRQKMASVAYAISAEYGVPKGVIVMWSGMIADIPSGWALCDGSNGTPDLRDKFIVGAQQDDSGTAKTNIAGILKKTGGSVNITEANLPSHIHGAGTLAAANESSHRHNERANSAGFDSSPVDLYYSGGVVRGGQFSYLTRTGTSDGYGGEDYKLYTGSGSAHGHSIIGSTDTKGSGTAYTQPYYALAFIMKL